MPIRILIADDHALFREMLREMLPRKKRAYTVIGEAEDGNQILSLVTRYHPDLLLLDYRMPGLGSLASFCRKVARRSPHTSTLLLTGFAEEGIALEAAVGGAKGYVLKGAPVADLLSAIATIHAGGIWVDPHLPRQIFRSFLRHSGEHAEALAKLTRQELKILSLVAHGMNNPKIGSRLHISEKTVKNHFTHIFAKLGVADRQKAVSLFLRPGSTH